MSKRGILRITYAVIGVAVVLTLIGVLVSANPNEATKKFAGLHTGDRMSVNEAFKADVICLLPTGVSPFTYLNEAFSGKYSDRPYDFRVTNNF
jgi:hypothetical protein